MRELNKSLKQHGFKSGEIHGDMEQAQRIAELDLFKDGTINILVASDVAARGLDVKGVSHVFNFDAPWHPDDYVHRIGRTGRAGATGVAYTLVTSEDAENIANIEKLTGQKIERLTESEAGVEEAEQPKRRARRGDDGGGDKSDGTSDGKADREPRRPRPENERAETQPRARRADPVRDERRPARRDAARDDRPDEGWNGPVPEFLHATIGG